MSNVMLKSIGVPQGSVFEPILPKCYISELVLSVNPCWTTANILKMQLIVGTKTIDSTTTGKVLF